MVETPAGISVRIFLRPQVEDAAMVLNVLKRGDFGKLRDPPIDLDVLRCVDLLEPYAAQLIGALIEGL